MSKSIIKELNLTPEQAREVYWEMRREYYKEEVRNFFENAQENDEDIPMPSEETIDEIAVEFEDILGHSDSYSEAYWDCLDYAIEKVAPIHHPDVDDDDDGEEVD